ncbi:MAG TPA: rhodanese-like domain-containing protein [Ilumatobacter sp.]|jgi:glyoxylase-like metal-dependent hydrolase (beta-lactamase superfamily II)|nr:rhodanese-like domain-containing protein [Ilumatobacter sp.]
MGSVRTFVDEGLGHSSYLIDLGDGTAAIIDPPRFPTEQLAAAAARSITPRWTVDTHSHADYVSGSPGLAARDGLTFAAPAASRLATPHVGLHEADRVALAPGVSLRVIATPGHTLDHHVYVLERDGVDVALFSGGSLMVGTVGRTDLHGPELTEPLAHDMFRSLRRLESLPDGLAVYPTHGAGSFCSASGASNLTSTLGRERATNPLFRIDDEDAFVETLLAGFGSFPSYFFRLPELNRSGPRFYDRLPPLHRLDVEHVERHIVDGAVVIDTRSVSDYAAAHMPGSVSNALRPAFGGMLGWIIDLDQPIVIVAGEGQDRTEIVRQCLDIGHEALVGELDGGLDAWRTAGRRITGIPLVRADDMVGAVIDVRLRSEFGNGHVPGALNIELGALASAEVPDGPITVMCGHGERAMTGASLLAARGHRDVNVLDGGPDEWADCHGSSLAVF